MFRKTKIICTLGPAIDDDEKLKQMILNGLDCARLNFSHGTHEEQLVRIERIRRVREELGIPLPILLDTKGPEIRVRDFANKKVTLQKDSLFTFCSDSTILGDETKVGLSYPDLAKFVKPGDKILADDGKISFMVVEIKGKDVVTKVLNTYDLSNHKSINVPNVIIDMPYLSQVDKSDLKFGVEQCVDFVAASFVRRKQDVLDLRKFLDEAGFGGNKIKIISKIENTEGVANMQDIIDVSDGIMVARGDLGVEVPFKLLPGIQKDMISRCCKAGKIVVTATQMLDSMQQNPRPTRAEVSDVANAIYDRTTAIMLSGESAAGKYPIESVTAMKDIAEATEENINFEKRFNDLNLELSHGTVSTICNAAVQASYQINAKAIICVSINGKTGFELSYYKPNCPIIAICVDEKGCRQLNLAWNVYPIYAEVQKSTDELFEYAIAKAKASGKVKTGDTVIIVCGSAVGNTGTDMMKIHTI